MSLTKSVLLNLVLDIFLSYSSYISSKNSKSFGYTLSIELDFILPITVTAGA